MVRQTLLAAAIMLAVAVFAVDLRAQSAPISIFFGTFQGSGIAENSESLYFGTTTRDLDVVIAPAGDGFTVAWTTVIRSGGDPKNPDVKRKAQTVRFSPLDRPGLFRGDGSGDPLAGEPYIWARATGYTLTIYIMTVADSGSYDVQSYARTVSGGGMDLVFSRIRDGEQIRQARAKLVKVAN